ncbi:azurin [Lysobacter fragariae]
MNVKIALIVASCALALSACGDRTPNAEPDTATAPAATPPETAPAPPPAPAPVETVPATPDATATTPPPAATPAPTASAKPPAVVSHCATQIEGTDAMQFNVGSITVPASCRNLKITLKHAGKLAITVMGHNVVIARTDDMQGIAADGVTAGLAANYIKAGDTRVVAHSPVVGGGQTTSVSVPVSKIKDGGPYEFFCSSPGHSALMRGTIAVQ